MFQLGRREIAVGKHGGQGCIGRGSEQVVTGHLQECFSRIPEAFPVGRPHAGNFPAFFEDVTITVHDHSHTHLKWAELDGSISDSSLLCLEHPGRLPHRGSGPGTHTAAARIIPGKTGLAGRQAHRGIGTYGYAAVGQIIDATLADNGNHGKSRIVAHAMGFETAHHAIGSGKTIGRTA